MRKPKPKSETSSRVFEVGSRMTTRSWRSAGNLRSRILKHVNEAETKVAGDIRLVLLRWERNALPGGYRNVSHILNGVLSIMKSPEKTSFLAYPGSAVRFDQRFVEITTSDICPSLGWM